jgi:hypothetical protein
MPDMMGCDIWCPRASGKRHSSTVEWLWSMLVRVTNTEHAHVFINFIPLDVELLPLREGHESG